MPRHGMPLLRLYQAATHARIFVLWRESHR